MENILVYVVIALCAKYGIKYHSHKKEEFEKGIVAIKNIPTYSYGQAIKILADYVSL